MPKRKTKPVTLAGRIEGRNGVRRGYEDATPERLARALTHGEASVDAAGVRRIAEPFDLLRTRKLLDRADTEVNELLWQAGDRLRAHWRRSMLDTLTALDISRPSVDGGLGPGGLTATESVVRHRGQYRRAEEAIGPRLLPYVEGAVVGGLTVQALRPLVADTGHARTADALVLERLREGLHRLCELWDMRPGVRPRRHGAWRAPHPEPDPASDARED